MKKPTPAEERFWNKVNKKGKRECWEWTGYTLAVAGFGYLGTGVRGKSILAHRFSYALHNGDIPKGATVKQTCGNPLCVNPGHLRLGDYSDNARRPLAERFWRKVQKGARGDCWPWTGSLDAGGYPQIGDGPRVASASRVSYMLRWGRIEKDAVVLHRCGNCQCVNPAHLRLADRSKIGKNRRLRVDRRGENNPAAKVTEAEVRKMRRWYESGRRRVGELAEIFHLNRHQVSRIVHGKAWQTQE